jgi:hypothetical protein
LNVAVVPGRVSEAVLPELLDGELLLVFAPEVAIRATTMPIASTLAIAIMAFALLVMG